MKLVTRECREPTLNNSGTLTYLLDGIMGGRDVVD
jgi:hypothetical protein